MRRRLKESDLLAPPLPLSRYRGSTSREAVAWLEARDAWWTETQSPDDPGWLAWILDGYDQVGEMPWCGSVGAPCDDDDCLCVVMPYISPLDSSDQTDEDKHSDPQGSSST